MYASHEIKYYHTNFPKHLPVAVPNETFPDRLRRYFGKRTFQYHTVTRNCYFRRSPLEIGLILCLLVCFMWLIVMASVYIYGAIMKESASCGDLCCVLQNNTYTDVDFNIYNLESTASDKKIKSISFQQLTFKKDMKRQASNGLNLNQYIGVLYTDLYSDRNNNEMFLKCSTVLITPTSSLSPKTCVENVSIDQLQVNIGRLSWSDITEDSVRVVKNVTIMSTMQYALIKFDAYNFPAVNRPKTNFLEQLSGGFANYKAYSFVWNSRFYKHRDLKRLGIFLLPLERCLGIGRIHPSLHPHVFCGYANDALPTKEDLKFPLVSAAGNSLLGLQIHFQFDDNTNTAHFLYLNVFPFNSELFE